MKTLIEKYTTIAKTGGSTATTTRDLLRWLRKNWTSRVVTSRINRLRAIDGDMVQRTHYRAAPRSRTFMKKFSNDERDIRRCFADREFRAKKIAEIK